MFKAIEKQSELFRRSPPGKRFEARYRAARAARKNKPAVWRIVTILAAVVAIVIGVLASLIPGVPGFVFILAAGALLAAESLRVARALDHAELKIRAWLSAVKRRWRKVRGT